MSDERVDPDDTRFCFGCGARLADEAEALDCWFCDICAPLVGGSGEYQLYEFPDAGALYAHMLEFSREIADAQARR